MQLHVHRASLLQQCRELVLERNTIASELAAALQADSSLSSEVITIWA